jgi:hypothetical protein
MFEAFERCHTTVERGQWAETWIEVIKHVAELYEEATRPHYIASGQPGEAD